MGQDFYARMGKELRALFKDLKPLNKSRVKKHLEEILKAADQIGGSIQEEAKQLHFDAIQFLKKPDDPKLSAILRQHALRLEQETREL